MKLAKRIFLLFCFFLLAACASATETDPIDSYLPTSPPTLDLRGSQADAPTRMTTSEYLLSIVPNCDGVQIFEEPVKFDWPLIKRRIKELEESEWGYYGCPQPQADVSTFYRENMHQTPYLMVEVNWVEKPQGTLGLFYNSVKEIWVYLWVVPQPSDPQAAYVIVVKSETSEFVPGECRLAPPDWMGVRSTLITFNKQRGAE